MSRNSNWMSDWESDRDEFEERLQHQQALPTIKPYLKEEPKPNGQQGAKYGVNQFGQMTMFPIIDNPQEKANPVENT